MVYCYSLRGIAQLVACLVRDQEASGSNPDTPTTKKHLRKQVLFRLYSSEEREIACGGRRNEYMFGAGGRLLFLFFAGGMLIKTDRVR